jgi:hypothetical protein
MKSQGFVSVPKIAVNDEPSGSESVSGSVSNKTKTISIAIPTPTSGVSIDAPFHALECDPGAWKTVAKLVV